METFKYLPTKDGGFTRKAMSAMSASELKFVELTKGCDPRVNTDRQRVLKLAQTLLFSK